MPVEMYSVGASLSSWIRPPLVFTSFDMKEFMSATSNRLDAFLPFAIYFM